jgi:hypothetical protein
MGWSILDAGFTPNLVRIARRFTVERLLARDLVDYEYIIDYWGRTGVDIDLRVAPMMQRLKS